MRFKTLLFLLIVSSLFSLSTYTLFADYTIYGEVYNIKTSEAIPGASIRIMNTNKGTYSSTRGKFRIPFLNGKIKIKVSSLGYKSKVFDINKNTDSLKVYLEPVAIMLNGVEKVEAIDVNEVVRRAIARKKNNLKKLKTFQGTLYSKLVMELGGDIFQASSEGSSFTLSASLGDKAPDKYKMFVMETFSDVKTDLEKNKKHIEITQRRQTANMTPESNLMAIGEFINFYDEYIDFFNIEIATPLNHDAFSYYDFEMLDKTILDDRYIYIIKVTPNTNTFPVFEGTISIVEKTYNLIELDLKPSEKTAIPFMEDIHFVQKFSEIERDIWFPTYLFVSAKADVEILKGIMEVNMDVKVTSIFSDVLVNKKLPDYLYKKNYGYDKFYGFVKDSLTGKVDSTRKYRLRNRALLTVAKMADSSDIDYWEKNSLREISKREKEMYRMVDSLVAEEDTLSAKSGDDWLPFDYSPYLDCLGSLFQYPLSRNRF